MSIRQVAERAGVSISTVSHVLNGTKAVGEEARARVVAAVRDTGYQHNASARALRTGRTLVLGHLLSHLSRNPWYARLAHAVERRAAEIGYGVLLAAGEGPALARSRMSTLVARRVDGVIVTTASDVETLRVARRAGLPTVAVERTVQLHGVGFVEVDQAAGTRAVTEALLDLGHRAVAFLGFRPLNGHWADADRQRLAGFREALSARGLEPKAVKLLPWPTGDERPPANARLAAAEILAADGRPTAIVAGSDLLAMAVLQVAYELRLRVPDDLSVTGWDDTVAAATAPPLTAVAAPFDEMGRAAVDLVVSMIAGGKRPEEARVLLTPSVTWRRSAAAPPASRASEQSAGVA